MYTFTMVGCTLFKFCHFKCAKAYLLEILGMSRLWHDLMAHGHKQRDMHAGKSKLKSQNYLFNNSMKWGIGLFLKREVLKREVLKRNVRVFWYQSLTLSTCDINLEI